MSDSKSANTGTSGRPVHACTRVQPAPCHGRKASRPRKIPSDPESSKIGLTAISCCQKRCVPSSTSMSWPYGSNRPASVALRVRKKPSAPTSPESDSTGILAQVYLAWPLPLLASPDGCPPREARPPSTPVHRRPTTVTERRGPNVPDWSKP